MEFNEKLQELRKQRGLTQEELAQKLYVSRTAVSKWEAGRGYPNIVSLKAIAKFFSVTLDELLSADEVLTIAEEDSRRARTYLRDMVFGLLDLSMVMLLFLPLFAQRGADAVYSVPLISLSVAQPYLKVVFFTAVIVSAAVGITTLALQNCRASVWQKGKTTLSLVLGIASVLLYVLSLQPYAAVFTFALLTIKALMLLKHK